MREAQCELYTEKSGEKWLEIFESLPLGSRDVLSDLSSVRAVVHEEQFNVFLVSDQELLESACKHMSGLVVLLAADLWSSDSASESTSHGGIHTSLCSPRFLNKKDKSVNSRTSFAQTSSLDSQLVASSL